MTANITPATDRDIDSWKAIASADPTDIDWVVHWTHKPILQLVARLDAEKARADAAETDAARYRWLRDECAIFQARTILNDSPEGIDKTVDSFMKAWK